MDFYTETKTNGSLPEKHNLYQNGEVVGYVENVYLAGDGLISAQVGQIYLYKGVRIAEFNSAMNDTRNGNRPARCLDVKDQYGRRHMALVKRSIKIA